MAIFRFQLKVAEYDPDGYYPTKWEDAIPVVVYAQGRKEADQKAIQSMGPPPSQRGWLTTCDNIEELFDASSIIRA